MRNAWLAAVLNVIPIFGMGYLYAGHWGRFLVVISLQLFSLMPLAALGLRRYNTIFLVLVMILSVVDAYRIVKADNARRTLDKAIQAARQNQNRPNTAGEPHLSDGA